MKLNLQYRYGSSSSFSSCLRLLLRLFVTSISLLKISLAEEDGDRLHFPHFV